MISAEPENSPSIEVNAGNKLSKEKKDIVSGNNKGIDIKISASEPHGDDKLAIVQPKNNTQA